MKLFALAFLLFLASFKMSSQISAELYMNLPDTLKPKNSNKPNLKELCAIVDNTALSLTDFSDEMKTIVVNIEKQTPSLTTKKEKIMALYTLMIYNFNFNDDDTFKLKYNKLLLSTIGKNHSGYEKQYFNCLMIKANMKSDEYNFEEAINLIKTALNEESKIKKRNIVAGAYLTLSDIYKKIHIYDESLYSLNKASKTADAASDYYLKYLKHYVSLKKSELDILNYIDTKDDNYLKNAKADLKKTYKQNLKDRWLSLWYLQNAYISYLEKNYALSQQQLNQAMSISFDDKEKNGSIACRYDTLKGLLLIKNKNESEGVKFLEDAYTKTGNEFYYEITLKELYEFYKLEKNYSKANFYLEKVLETKTIQDNFKYKGAVFTANKKYDVREKQIEIERLESQAKIKKNKNYLIISAILLAFFIVVGFFLFKNKQAKIKELKTEQEFFEKIKLMQEYLNEEEKKMETERNTIASNQKIEIGQNLHNDVLGSIVALNYLIEDYKNKSENDHEKSGFTEIALEVNSIYNELRNFSHSLTTPDNLTYSFDAISYLENIKNRFSEIGLLDIDFHADKEKLEHELSSRSKAELYYLIKESVSNTIKHANASKLSIEIFFDEATCYIKISDNGNGLKPKSNEGIGLSSIKERIEKINGTFKFESNALGTNINVNIPARI